jgi:hypothetical protein
MSLPKSKTVHGVEIKKVPVGKYLSAMRELEELPGRIINSLFPGKSLDEILASFSGATDDTVINLAITLLRVAPEHAIEALAVILSLDAEVIKNNLTPKELSDVVKAFWELNDMTDFFADVSGLLKKMLPTLIANGSRSGSPSERPSGSPKKTSSKGTI